MVNNLFGLNYNFFFLLLFLFPAGNSCHPEEFQRMVNFLTSKVGLRNNKLSLKERQQKALILAETFIKSNNSITTLDKRTMKMLDEFEKANG